MRIGLFSDAYLPEISGVTMAIYWLKQELEDLGYTVYIYAPRYPEIRDEEAHLVRFPARPFIFKGCSRDRSDPLHSSLHPSSPRDL